VAIELTPELMQLEERAWAEQQASALTIETALAVQQAITAHAEATGENRYEVERALKKKVRHPEPDAS
jgi:replication-associated recombination protein RarA